MACGSCGKRDVKVQYQNNTKVCPKCHWNLQRVFQFSPVTRKMVETWKCPNNKCKYVENNIK